MQITCGDKEFLVHFRDDGVGIDSATLAAGSRPGHWGLKGMTERARQMGGAPDIWSRTGGGTEVALKIPGAVAYRRPTTCWPWRPKRKLSGPGA